MVGQGTAGTNSFTFRREKMTFSFDPEREKTLLLGHVLEGGMMATAGSKMMNAKFS